jgi:hypothetical protein
VRIPAILLLLIAVTTEVCAANDRRAMTAEVDQFCEWMHLKRLTGLRAVHFSEGGHATGKVDISVDGRRRPYLVIFYRDRREQGQLKIFYFEPEDVDYDDHGLGFDTLKDYRRRAWAVEQVKKLNQHLHWKWVFGPEIQAIGRDTLVTYETVRREEPKKMKYGDARRAHDTPSPPTRVNPALSNAESGSAEAERIIVTGVNIPTDAYVSFLVSPKGTVFAAFFGS